MAELIDKGALLKEYDKLPIQKVAEVDCGDAYRTRPLVDLGRVNDMICSQTTITEAEIRAKAIDEFAEKMKELTYKWIDKGIIAIGCIDEIAEQMKGE